MDVYLDLLKELQKFPEKDNRTGIPTKGKFVHHMEFDMSDNSIPIITTKQMAIKGIIGELLGFIRGADNNKIFNELCCKVWNDNANNHATDADGNIVSRNAWLDSPHRKGVDDLGRIYGVQWRNWDSTFYMSNEEKYDMESRLGEVTGPILKDMGYTYMGYLDEAGLHVYRKQVDQLAYVVDQLINNPTNRRIIVSAWNPGELDMMALPPCHAFHQYNCEPLQFEDRVMLLDDSNAGTVFAASAPDRSKVMDALGIPKYRLNMMTYIRSNDVFLGTPFNITSYAILLKIMCRITGHVPGTLHYITGDTHIYVQHMDGVNEQLDRKPFENKVELKIADHLQTLEDFEKATPDDFELVNYKHHGKLISPTPMAI